MIFETESIIGLEWDKNGNLKYWIDKDDPRFGRSLWKRDSEGSRLVKNIPVKFKSIYNQGGTTNV